MEKVYLFGGGNNAYGVVEYIGSENVIAIVDNEPKKQGDMFLGLPIISFEEYIGRQQGEEIVITTAMYEEIVQQLEDNNISNYSIAPMVVMGIVTPEEIVEECNLREKKECYIIGRNIIAQKFCDWVYTEGLNLKINIVFEERRKNISDSKESVKFVSDTEVVDDAELIIFKEKISECDRKRFARFRKIYDIYDMMPRKNTKFVGQLQKYKDKHKGEKCFVIGNGPSLSIEDLEKLHRLQFPNFGVNLIYKMYPDTIWRPTYYVITEYNIYRTYYDEIANLQHDNMFVKNFYNKKETSYLENVSYYPGYARRSYYEEQKFTSEISKVVYSGYSVTFDALQLAVYMGFKEIYLIGLDFSYLNDPGQKGNHVYDNKAEERRKVAGRAYLDATIMAFETARRYAEDSGIKIYNATRGGNLEVFERKNLDEVFAEIEKNEM